MSGAARSRPIAGAPRVVLSSQGGLLDVVLSPRFDTDKLVYLTYAEPSANGGSGLALARGTLVQDGTGARIEGLKRLWHDPAGGEGGQFGAIVAFAPDGQSLFLSSGERQRFTPAQSASQPIGKILHLTLDGAPAPGNPWAGRVGAATVTVTDPPEDTEAAKSAAGAILHLARAEPDRSGNLDPGASQSLWPRLRFPRPPVGDRNGPSRRR